MDAGYETVYANRWFSVERNGNWHRVRQANGDRGAVILLVVDGTHAVLVRQRRHTVERDVWELPRGGAEDGETVERCAAREALEEAGCAVDPSAVEVLGGVSPDTGVLCSTVRVVRAMVGRSSLSERADPGEVDAVRLVRLSDLPAMVADGTLSDGLSLAALALHWCRPA